MVPLLQVVIGLGLARNLESPDVIKGAEATDLRYGYKDERL